MEDIDKEINYYEKMLGLDKNDAQSRNQKKQLKQELETDNMFELFTCVDNILGDDFAIFGDDNDQEDPSQFELQKRPPMKSKQELLAEEDLSNYKKKLSYVKKLLTDKKTMKKDLLKNKSKELVQLFKSKNFSLKDIVHSLVESVLFNPDAD